ncbi:hypothetical protein [Synechococcus sp. UW140]|uniref:hypothetical protein n=1 Tax=Synechococcus sp. UW140 TaxID=368503 RepID=UPI003137E4B6
MNESNNESKDESKKLVELKLIAIQVDFELPRQQWLNDPAGVCRHALSAHGEPLRWAITAAELRADLQWLQLEAVLLV